MSNSDDASSKWDDLCRELESAEDAYRVAFGPVNARFRAVGEGKSHINPTREELAQLEQAELRREDVKRRMKEFLEPYRQK
jgi:hypothetical protein